MYRNFSDTIIDLKAELLTLKCFVMKKLYGTNKNTDRVRMEQYEQGEHPEKLETVWKENAPDILNIKTLIEILAPATNSHFKSKQMEIQNHKNE